MSDDHELLEKAAKAAGYTGIISFGGYVGVMVPCNPVGTSKFQRWNPLTDDGDALRLAVEMGMEMDLLTGDKVATTVWYESPTVGAWKVHEPHGTDPYAATRRAIVRAAASIGPTPTSPERER